ncbi:hypothetical protein ACVMFA_007210 [Bradyrhizobium liaoningense]
MNSSVPTHKFTLALNKRVEDTTVLFMEVIRAALSVGTNATAEERNAMQFLNFLDADGNDHRDISALSLIIMRGTSGELKKFGDSARERRLRYVSITKNMSANSATPAAGNKPAEPEYVAVLAFGGKSDVESATGRLSLWR